MPNVVRFTLSTAQDLNVPGAGRFIGGVLDVDANDLKLLARTRYLTDPYGAIEVGIVDSTTPKPSLPAVPVPPVADPYPQYLDPSEVIDSGTGKLRADKVPDRLSDVELRAALLPKWKTSTAYAQGEPVVNPSGQLVTANAAFTSGASYVAGNWTVTAGAGGRGTGGDAPATWIAGFHRGVVSNPQIERLHLAVSADGLEWRTLVPDFTPPSGTVRDPQFFKVGDLWYVVYTSISFGTGTTFGLATSPDLITWTHLSAPSVAAVSGSNQAWAPTPMFDTDGLHVIVSVNNQLYEMHPTAADLSAWSAPVKLTGAGIPAGVIDGHVTKVGSTYHLFAKDNTGGNDTSFIIHSTASALTGPYTSVGTGDWAGWGHTLEAPALVDLGSGANPRYRLYFDHFLKGLTFYAESNDLTTFTAKKLAWTDLPHPRHMTPRLVGTDAALLAAQQRIDRNPIPVPDGRKSGLFQAPAGWRLGAGNKPPNATATARLTRLVAPRDMRVVAMNFSVTVAATANDAVDLAIYDEDFQRVGSSGPVTGLLNAGVGIRSANLAAPVTLRKGRVYFVGLSFAASTGTAATVRALEAGGDQDFNLLGGGAAGQIDGYFQSPLHPFPATLLPQQYNGGPLQTSFITYAVALLEG